MTSWLSLNTSPISMSLTCPLLLVRSTCISTSASAQGEYIFGLLLPHGSPLHCPPLNSQRDLYKIRSYPFHAQISSMALTALQDLALAHLSGFVPHQSPSHSWAQPRWLFFGFLLEHDGALSLPQDLCTCASAENPLPPALWASLLLDIIRSLLSSKVPRHGGLPRLLSSTRPPVI